MNKPLASALVATLVAATASTSLAIHGQITATITYNQPIIHADAFATAHLTASSISYYTPFFTHEDYVAGPGGPNEEIYSYLQTYSASNTGTGNPSTSPVTATAATPSSGYIDGRNGAWDVWISSNNSVAGFKPEGSVTISGSSITTSTSGGVLFLIHDYLGWEEAIGNPWAPFTGGDTTIDFLLKAGDATANATSLSFGGAPAAIISVSITATTDTVIGSNLDETIEEDDPPYYSHYRFEDNLGDPAVMFALVSGTNVIARGMHGISANGTRFSFGSSTAALTPAGLTLTPAANVAGTSIELKEKTFLPGDLNGDLKVDLLDVDLLAVRARTSPGSSGPLDVVDLNVDGTVSFSTAAASDASVAIRTLLDSQFGDLDLDGDVDATDLAHLQANYGNTRKYADGDLDGDGDVDAADEAILNGYLGWTR